MKNIDQLIYLTKTSTVVDLKKRKNIVFSEFNKIDIDKNNREKFFDKIIKIKNIINNPKTQESFIKSYHRIFKNQIDKDGRGSSIVVEITRRCNKNCLHCYSKDTNVNLDMADCLLDKIIEYSRKKFKHVFLTGGEPSLDERVLSIAKNNPDVIFFMFTNSSTMNEKYAKKLSDLGNVIPMLSIDGNNEKTHDFLRGKGSFKEVQKAIEILNKNKVSWGFISLVTELNAKEVLHKDFIKDKKERGAFIARYLEYLPVGATPLKELILSGETYYLLEKRKKEIIKSNEIYMQKIGQKKCEGLLFISMNGDVKNCFCFHYSKYNIKKGNISNAIENTKKEWTSYDWDGECPIYSDPIGLKNYLQKIGWKNLSSIDEPYLNKTEIAKKLMRNYRQFLKIKTERIL